MEAIGGGNTKVSLVVLDGGVLTSEMTNLVSIMSVFGIDSLLTFTTAVSRS